MLIFLYADPGAGALALQLLLALLLGGLFYVRTLTAKVKSWFTGKKETGPAKTEDLP